MLCKVRAIRNSSLRKSSTDENAERERWGAKKKNHELKSFFKLQKVSTASRYLGNHTYSCDVAYSSAIVLSKQREAHWYVIGSSG
jgi:hypothetical protein